MALAALRRRDHALLGLFERSAGNVHRASTLLRELIADYPEASELAREVLLCEQEGDRITHDIIHRLHERGHGKAPFARSDVYALATALDDVVDYAEQAADALGLYAIEAPMERAIGLADVLVRASEEIGGALRALRGDGDPATHLVEIHRLENEGDRLQREGVAALFINGIDPMVVIRWKDIFDALEQAVDACETVAHIIEGITLQRRR